MIKRKNKAILCAIASIALINTSLPYSVNAMSNENSTIIQTRDITNMKVYNTSSLNIRKGPGTKYAKIGTVYNNNVLEVIEISNGWAKINYKNGIGYCSAKYLKTVSSSTKKEMVVKVNDLNVRSGAGAKYNKLGSLNKGTKVTVISTLSNGWVKIEYKNGYGYISNVKGAYLEAVSSSNPSVPGAPSTPDVPSTPETTVTKYSANEAINLRKTESWKGEVITVIKKGVTFDVVSIDNGWAKANYNGKTGFVPASHITKVDLNSPSVPDSNPSTPDTTPSTKKEMIVKVNDLSVRSGAGVKYNKLGSLNKGTKVTVISTLSNGWVKIEYKNGYGYISNVKGAYLEEVIENNQEKIAKVIAMIDALPAKIELIHEQQVINVTNAFNNLSIDEQNKIPFPQRASLESAKATISLLKKEIDDKEIVANLIQRIEELKNKKINLQDHETEIKEIRTKYDALGYTRRDEVTNYEEFLRIELDLTHIYEDIIHLESLIKELPSVIENSYGAKVEQAKKEFNLLTDKNQVGVKSELVEKLKDAIIQADRLKEEIVNSNQEVKTLVVDIEQLSIIEDITIDDKDQVFGLMTRYRSLPDNVKFAVDITTVEEAFDKIEGIMAEEVVELIDNLPSIDNLELTDEALLEEARNKYREISSKNNKLVTNIDILTNLEIKMLELQQKEQVIIEIVNKIKNLDNDVTFDNLDEITEKVNEIEALINNSVDEMNQEEKEKFYDSIINIEKLDEIITQIEILNRVSHITTIDEIIELINNIPDDVINIELRHRNNLKDIRNAITKIGAENQISPELMTKVENAEKEIKRLEEDINQVISAIHRLPEIDEITLDDEEQILEAKALYDSKDDRVTHFVNNSSFISKLEDALIKINDLKNLK